MRVLFTSLPSTGHFNSVMPLARAAAAAGHDVAVCCAGSYADEVQAVGLQHLPGGADSLESLADGAPPMGDPGRPAFMQLEVFARRAPERLIPDLTAHALAWRPDVLARESSEFAACLVAEQLDLPHASVGTGAWSSRDERRAFFADALSALRVDIGLPRDPDGCWSSWLEIGSRSRLRKKYRILNWANWRAARTARTTSRGAAPSELFGRLCACAAVHMCCTKTDDTVEARRDCPGLSRAHPQELRPGGPKSDVTPLAPRRIPRRRTFQGGNDPELGFLPRWTRGDATLLRKPSRNGRVISSNRLARLGLGGRIGELPK